MSGQNLEIVRQLFARWNSGDHTIQTEYLDPAVELHSPLASVSGEPFRGHAGIREWTESIDAQFAEFRTHADEMHEVDDQVVAVGIIHLRGRASGVELDQPAVWTVHFGPDHRITRVHISIEVSTVRDAKDPG
jgi:ketosteroid isomerase-like protein